jgi:hypothetical protein
LTDQRGAIYGGDSTKKAPTNERRGQFREELREKSWARMTSPTVSRGVSSSQHKMEDFHV